MKTGDKVLALLGAKALCCVLLILASTGALGGAFAWFLDQSIGWLIGAALAVGVAAIIWRSGAAQTRSSATNSTGASDPGVRQRQQIS